MQVQLAIEATTVGLLLAGLVQVALSLGIRVDAVTAFVLGVIVHLGFEITGLNAKYCAVGNACRRRWSQSPRP
jgi:hypothetical protein